MGNKNAICLWFHGDLNAKQTSSKEKYAELKWKTLPCVDIFLYTLYQTVMTRNEEIPFCTCSICSLAFLKSSPRRDIVCPKSVWWLSSKMIGIKQSVATTRPVTVLVHKNNLVSAWLQEWRGPCRLCIAISVLSFFGYLTWIFYLLLLL